MAKVTVKDLPIDLFDELTLEEFIELAGLVQTLLSVVKVLVARVKGLFG